MSSKLSPRSQRGFSVQVAGTKMGITRGKGEPLCLSTGQAPGSRLKKAGGCLSASLLFSGSLGEHKNPNKLFFWSLFIPENWS